MIPLIQEFDTLKRTNVWIVSGRRLKDTRRSQSIRLNLRLQIYHHHKKCPVTPQSSICKTMITCFFLFFFYKALQNLQKKKIANWFFYFPWLFWIKALKGLLFIWGKLIDFPIRVVRKEKNTRQIFVSKTFMNCAYEIAKTIF